MEAGALVPIALCIGAIIVAAIAYSIVTKLRERADQRREEEAWRAYRSQGSPCPQTPGAHRAQRRSDTAYRGKHSR